MADLGLGVGLAAMAFWGFIAATVFAGVWNGIRKRDAQHETVRRLIESGQPIDQQLLERLALVGDGGNKRHDQELHVTALWLLPVSVGLAIFALVLGSDVPEALAPLLGAAGLTACLGVGWLIAARIAARWYASDANSAD